jgi:transposase
MEISYKQKSIIEETGKIKELLEKGYKTKEISKMLNIKRVTIYNRIRRMKNEN